MRIEKIKMKRARPFFREWHYSGGLGNAAMIWGLLDADDLIAAIAYAVPCSNAARSALFGAEHMDRVYDLQRMARSDRCDVPMSRFLAMSRAALLSHRPLTRGLTAFADSTEGHHGGVYQADNWLFTGTTGRARFWIDTEGRLRHPRQCGVNITPGRAADMGWTPTVRGGKYRYVKIVGPDRRELRRWHAALRLEVTPHPKPAPRSEPAR